MSLVQKIRFEVLSIFKWWLYTNRMTALNEAVIFANCYSYDVSDEYTFLSILVDAYNNFYS